MLATDDLSGGWGESSVWERSSRILFQGRPRKTLSGLSFPTTALGQPRPFSLHGLQSVRLPPETNFPNPKLTSAVAGSRVLRRCFRPCSSLGSRPFLLLAGLDYVQEAARGRPAAEHMGSPRAAKLFFFGAVLRLPSYPSPEPQSRKIDGDLFDRDPSSGPVSDPSSSDIDGASRRCPRRESHRM